MVRLQGALLAVMIFALISSNESASPFFLQAITSALGTIPFSAGPLTTGLVGAKLAVGSKLLYYLGFFGRRRSKAKSAPVQKAPQPNLGFGNGAQFPGGMQAVPPFGFGGFPQQQFGGFPQQQFGGFPQQQFGGFGQHPLGYDPAQVFQMLAAQGIDPVTAMQAMNMNGMGGNQAVPAFQSPFPSGGGFDLPQNKQTDESFVNAPSNVPDPEIENFFKFLQEMDDNSCISRLICDIGANPSFLGEFSENIHGIVGSLNVKSTSGAYPYVTIMKTGAREGKCDAQFPQCGNSAYEVVKSVAPSVGLPNVDAESINNLK